MEKTGLWGFNKKPFALKVLVLLLFIYGTVNFISKFIYTFYVGYSGGGLLDINLSFGFMIDTFLNMFYLFVICIPVILTFIAAILIWRGRRLGYWASIILLIPGFIVALSGLSYLVINLPKLFTEDLLFLTRDTSGMTWILNGGYFDDTYTESLTIMRIILINSFLKAFVGIASFGFLIFIVLNNKSYFKKR